MITISKCSELGLEKQSKKLYEQMRKNYEFFSPNESDPITSFSEIYVEQAFSNFGIDFSKVKGRKWYEFNKNDWEERVYNALRLIQD